MTAPKDAAGRIASRLLASIDDLLPMMVATYQAEIDAYARLTARELEHEVLATSRRFIEGYFGRVAQGRQPARPELPEMAQAGRRRLEMGLPLDAALHAFRLAGRETWRAAADLVEPGEEGALAALAGGWIEYLDRASSFFAEGYLAASHDQLRRLDARRSAIVDALLDAQDAAEVAAVGERFVLSLAATYRPVLLAGDEVHVRLELLLQHAPADTFAGRRGAKVLVLLPDEEVEPVRLAKVAHATLSAYGRPARPGPALAAEVRHADAVLHAAARAGHLEGTFGPEDLLLEQLVHANERAAEELANRVLAPVAAQDPEGIFLDTVRRYLASGSIPETARNLGVHQNTVAYRLRRVRELSGLDPRIPTEAALLVVACTPRGGPAS